MGKSSFMKRKDGNVITKKMMTDKMEQMATLMTVMEATLMEWEIWYRLIKHQKKNLTPEQYEFFVLDGPILTEYPSKIMASIRAQIPEVSMEEVEAAEAAAKKPAILGADGLPAQAELPRILDASGHTPNPLAK